jgi:dienelactone hydrolase
MTMASLILLSLIVLGPVDHGDVSFRPTSQESSVPERFQLTPAVFRFEVEHRLDTEFYTVSAVRFPSPIVSPEPENNTVHAEYFRPKREGRRPAVVVLHILGADFALSRYLASRLADQGVAALFVKLPYYGERRPRGEDKRFLSTDIERSVLAVRQGICDVRRAVAWLAARPEIDPNRLGVTGISLGGIVSSVAAAVEPSIQKGAFLLAGGDLASILWEMPEAAKYRDAWIKSGRGFQDLKVLTDPFDPLTYADRLRKKKIIMMAGNVDDVISPASARALWEAAGRPPITWYDCGHYSAVGYALPAIRRTVEFFEAE